MGIWLVMIPILIQVTSFALSTPTTCHIWYNQKLKGPAADCSRRNFTSVPLDLPANMINLRLSGNFLTNLTNGVFASYPALIILTLSNNRIENIDKDAFIGLNHLEELDLSSTDLFIDMVTYSQGIFDPVKNLKILYLGGFGFGYVGFTFPCYIFSPLTKLTELFIEPGTWPNFGECKELKNLQNLKSLTIAPIMDIGTLRNDTFIFLESIPLQNLSISGITYWTEDCVFCPLKNLTYLKIATRGVGNILTVGDATRLLYGFTNRNYIINEIDLNGVQDISNEVFTSVLNRETWGYLPEICVKRLILANNVLFHFYVSSIRKNDTFTKCIEYLDLSRNYFRVDFSYMFLLPGINYMINLKYLDFSQNMPIINIYSRHIPVLTSGCPLSVGRQKTHLDAGIESNTSIEFPPRLEYLNLSNSYRTMDVNGYSENVIFTNGDHLRLLDLSNSKRLDIPISMQGISNISYLDISGIDISEYTFTNSDMFTSVEILIAHNIYIYPTTLMSNYSNCILVMTKLKQLDLSRNRFNFVPVELLSLPSLTYLDLSFNSINVIKKEERELLDKKMEEQERFHLNIYGNTITCTCATIDFVKWLQETRVTIENKGNYSCLTDYGTMISITNFYNDFLQQWRRCVGQFWLTVAVSLQLLTIICLMSAFLLKKYLPKVEYQILRWLGMLETKRWDYEYDAYICYGDKDYRWPCHCLYKTLLERDETVKLYMPDLHDPFGEVKAEVIHDAMKRSWKLIIVITEDLFTDEWSHFKVLEALRIFSHEGVITSRILLLYQDISPEAEARIPKELLNVVPRKNILDVHPGDDFWTELHQMIIREDLEMEILF